MIRLVFVDEDFSPRAQLALPMARAMVPRGVQVDVLTRKSPRPPDPRVRVLLEDVGLKPLEPVQSIDGPIAIAIVLDGTTSATLGEKVEHWDDAPLDDLWGERERLRQQIADYLSFTSF